MKYSYRSDYQRTHDIDWFCKIGSMPVHIASNGGLIHPDILSRENFAVQTEVYNMPCIFSEDDVVICETAIRNIIFPNDQNFSEEAYGSYIKSFIVMARKGFISLDRIDIGETAECSEDERYIVVAYPKQSSSSNLSPDISNLLQEGLLNRSQVFNWPSDFKI